MSSPEQHQAGQLAASQLYAAWQTLQDEADAAREIAEELGTDHERDAYHALADEAEAAYGQYQAASLRELQPQAEPEAGHG